MADDVIHVGDFVARVGEGLRVSWKSVAVDGEASGVHRAPSGHVYFALKDDAGLIQCVMFAGAAASQPCPQNGRAFVVRGTPDVYAPRGQMQMKVWGVVPLKRDGDRDRERNALVTQLRDEGVLSRPRRPLPDVPTHVCIITSVGSAADADMRAGVATRWPALRTTVLDARVQGECAAMSLTSALHRAFALSPSADVVIVGRGGGSEDDLWAFNEPVVARTIAGAPVPVVSAVGHESDRVVTDLVADVRAKTPTAAIELVVPDVAILLLRLTEAWGATRVAACHALRGLRGRATSARDSLARAPKCGLKSAQARLERATPHAAARQALARAARCTERAAPRLVDEGCEAVRRNRVLVVRARARFHESTGSAISKQRRRMARVFDRQREARDACIAVHRSRLSTFARTLAVSDPRHVLRRGFAIVRDESGNVITDAEGASAREQLLTLRFADGTVAVRVVGTT
jgi:exodeoxyribonuclease VII large subunit